MRKLPNHDINITITENGVMVRVGCRSFVSEDVNKAMREVKCFIMDQKTEFSEKYLIDAEPTCNEAAPVPEQAAQLHRDPR